MLERTQEHEEIIARVAACDIGKAEVMCCVRVPDEQCPGRRAQEVRPYSTMTRSLQRMADRLAELGVTRVVMEATSDYWKPVYYLLEARGFEVWLVNARDVKHLPGRPKSDTLDAAWLCKVAERQMLRASFVPPPPIRRLRALTRYRSDVVESRTAEKQRVEKMLEDAQIKLSVVASDIFGVSGREIMAALIDGQRDPRKLAELARGRLRVKIPTLVEALTGFFTEHHAFLLQRMLARIDAATADIDALDARIDELIAPFEPAIATLTDIPGMARRAATVLLSEIGADMNRFPTPAHLTSWAKFAPGLHESAGKTVGTSAAGHGNRYLRRILGEISMAAGRTNTHLGERHRRLARRIGPKKALVATGRHILVIIWHLLTNPDTPYTDLGTDYHHTHNNHDRTIRNHITQLHALGYRVTLEPVT